MHRNLHGVPSVVIFVYLWVIHESRINILIISNFLSVIYESHAKPCCEHIELMMRLIKLVAIAI